ncbi:MAG: DEAD/DEAH box helicase [Leptolyngbyaceae cyanobacterium bins.302]|nr:DEAD/DEAH box helicase [Leptolyngbyaceae cyanobacterium bins.302]
MTVDLKTLASPQTILQRNQLVEVYFKLPPVEQMMTQLFSVFYTPVNRTTVLACLSQMKATDLQGKAFTTQTLKPHIDHLIETGVLVQEQGQGPQCHFLLVEVATRDAVKVGRFEALVEAVEKQSPITRRWKDGPRVFSSEAQLIREVRIGIYRNDTKFIYQQFSDYHKYRQREDISAIDVYQQVSQNPFDAEWLQTLPQDLREVILVSLLNTAILELTPADEALSLLRANCAASSSPSDPKASLSQYVVLFEQDMLRGNLHTAQETLNQIAQLHENNFDSLWGWLSFLKGEDEKAIAYYTSALQFLKKNTGKRKIYFQAMSGIFFILALLKQGSPAQLAEALEYSAIARQAAHWLSEVYGVLENFIKLQQGDLSRKEIAIAAKPHAHHYSLEKLIRALCLYWVEPKEAATALPKSLEPFYQQAEAAGYHWFAMEAADLLSRFKPRSAYGKTATQLRQQIGSRSLIELLQPQETWELCLNALIGLQKADQTAPTSKSASSQRLAWTITFLTDSCVLQPREQIINAKGEWSKGRPIALKRLKSDTTAFSYLTPQDLKVCAQIKSYAHGWNKTEYAFGERAIALLVGHPLVFWENAPTVRVEIVKGEPELLVKKGKGGQLTLQFAPNLKENKNILVVKESPTRLKVIEITAEHRRIAEILGKKNRLDVPEKAKERVLAAINAVSSVVTVHSDIGGAVASAEDVPADSKPHIHLLPSGDGLKVAVLVRPFTQGGPYYRPGTGGATVIAEIEGKRFQTSRNLLEEKRLANAAIAACAILVQNDAVNSEWLIEDPEDCLELLLQLQALGESIVLEWPEGEKLRVNHQATLKDFSLTIKRQNDWFATSGELTVSNQQVLDMQQLMELLAKTPSRFIPLGDGQFLALTQEFRKRLDELRAFSEKSGKSMRLHPLAAIAVEDWIDEVGSLKADKYWKSHIQKLKEVQNLDPVLPSTLQADLRDYQIEGFRWLARLAHWGVGACLADDMGLGKTLQALAVILTRAAEGPTLIVAPTSVGMNWISEAERFAPTLNPIQFGSSDRQKLLDQLQPFDLLVCTYGLLQQEDVAEMLAKVQWQTIVLDEAQSIKNFATKRSQAAMNLQGGFKLLTTGTPIENHLGELWNLFRFINPGLLGSLEHFNQRFANPIERHGDKQARNQLKKLIQPFMLRRTKNQVLEELPSRTEILLRVDLSKEELAFYEALRREAIAKLSDSDATAGAKHLQVLAEIMKLRRACCNVRLVKPDLPLPSSKLHLFSEVLTELLENRHKALVFSQFVDHLRILRDYLDEQNIRYQYLDGSTPAPERKKRVNAFQAGEGDVFLISLKAGGTGLNLTAADYVIHMDPWWNPAVEDQASDRAHRIGQQRPVTIYRLVAKDTIEDKIVELHQHKRDLADSLLEGSDMSGKIATDELLRLIQES